MRPPRLLSALAATVLGSSLAVAHPTAPPDGHGHDEHGHGHGHDHGHAPGKGIDLGHEHHEREKPPPPTKEQMEKRLERVRMRAEARQQNRTQRAADRRQALRKRLGRKLEGAALAPPVSEELERNARRTAALRRIRYLGALENDFETVARVDRALARENSRHETWWRTGLSAKP